MRSRTLHRHGTGRWPHAAHGDCGRQFRRDIAIARSADGESLERRARRRHHASRHQAGQHHGARRRLREGARFRVGAVAARDSGRRRSCDAGAANNARHDDGHSRVYVARTGERPERQPFIGHLCARHCALRTGDGATSVQSGNAGRLSARHHVAGTVAPHAVETGTARRARRADFAHAQQGREPASDRRRSRARLAGVGATRRQPDQKRRGRCAATVGGVHHSGQRRHRARALLRHCWLLDSTD
ncbi:MAG: hypothetical protein JMDDDDMK_00443 [Acidobacteria bacterium]|nr:hypothetical protein [Acidobacteriota bacterium]